MKSILVYADRSPAMAPRLETALALAGSAGGHVTVLVDTPVARYVSMDPMGGSYLASAALDQALAADDEHAAAIEAQLSRQNVPFAVVRSDREPVAALAEGSRLADLVVLSRCCSFAGEVAITASTPVLVVPDDRALSVPVRSACIAWDGGQEAAAAVRGAVPILAACDRVSMITVNEKGEGHAPRDALDYLAAHGIQAALEQVERNGSIEQTLDAAVARIAPDLLVMGAYGHSRMRQYLFGGVTRHFLGDEKAPPLLLAH